VTLQSTQQDDPDPVTSTVRVVGGVLNPTTGAADVRVSVPRAAPFMLGEHVRAVIEVRKKEAALVVPRSAVLPDEDNKQVLFTVKDGKAVRHEVDVGITAGDLVEVTASGLNAGDAVVTLGNYELTDGMSIQAAEKDTQGQVANSKDDADEKSSDGANDDAGGGGSKDHTAKGAVKAAAKDTSNEAARDPAKNHAKDASKAPAVNSSKGDNS
jgi:hypothetical protein